MRTLKLLVVALFVALAGVVYTAGRAQDKAHDQHAAHAAKAGCCKARTPDAKQTAAHSCDMKDGAGCCAKKAEGSCCKAHKTEAAKTTTNAAAKDTKESCACCNHDKTDGKANASCGCCGSHEQAPPAKAATKVAAQDTGSDKGKSCCASCGSCCNHQVARH